MVKINQLVEEICSECGGSGCPAMDAEKCHLCEGEGVVVMLKKIEKLSNADQYEILSRFKA